MKKPNEITALLDMFLHPAFRVKDGTVCQVNSFAAKCRIEAGTPVEAYIPHDKDAYRSFHSGCLSLSIRVQEIDYIATVYATEDGEIFHLKSTEENAELRIIALAAQQLRSPLSEVMSAAGELFAKDAVMHAPENRQQAGIINKGLFQLLRQIGNMSAAASYHQSRIYGKEINNIVAVINETMEKAQALCSTGKHQLTYIPLQEDIYCCVDAEMLERALYNLVSNAIKYSPAGSPIRIKLVDNQDNLRFTVESQMADPTLTRQNLFTRYIRQADVEDGIQGFGLGIPLIQYAAHAHDGSLLMDHPNENTVRFTLSLSTASPKDPIVRSPFPDFDYMGGWDHGLVELSDVLPSSAYENL